MNRWGICLALGIALLGSASAVAEEPGYEISLIPLKNDWQAIRFHAGTGQSWFATGGDWKPVPEGSEAAPTAGTYAVITVALGDNSWAALRYDKKSGRSWKLAAMKWVEMKLLPEDKPAATGGATGGGGN